MAAIVIQSIDIIRPGGQDVYAPKRGDVIAAFPNGWIFGDVETGYTGWRIFRIADLTRAQAKTLTAPQMDILGEVVMRFRKRRVRFGQLASSVTAAELLQATETKPDVTEPREIQILPTGQAGTWDYSSNILELAGRYNQIASLPPETELRVVRQYICEKLGSGKSEDFEAGLPDDPFRPNIHDLLSIRNIRATYTDNGASFLVKAMVTDNQHTRIIAQPGVN